MIEALDFSYVANMNSTAALHMGILLGLHGKKALDYGLGKAGEVREQRRQKKQGRQVSE